MQLSTEWTADQRSEFELSEGRVEEGHPSARMALDAGDCNSHWRNRRESSERGGAALV